MKRLIILLLLIDVSLQMALFVEYVSLFKEFKVISQVTNFNWNVKKLTNHKHFPITQKAKYNKVYKDPMAEARAFKNFVRNRKYIDKWNLDNPAVDEDSLVLGENKWSNHVHYVLRF
jgi:hypothetical protein